MFVRRKRKGEGYSLKVRESSTIVDRFVRLNTMSSDKVTRKIVSYLLEENRCNMVITFVYRRKKSEEYSIKARDFSTIMYRFVRFSLRRQRKRKFRFVEPKCFSRYSRFKNTTFFALTESTSKAISKMKINATNRDKSASNRGVFATRERYLSL